MWYELEGGCDLYRDWILEIKKFVICLQYMTTKFGLYRFFVWKKKTSQQSENALPANIMILLFPLWNNFKSKVFYVILFLFHTLQLSTSQIIMPLIVRRALLKIFMRLFWVFMLICIVHILCRGNVSPKTSLELSWALYFSSSIKKIFK